MITWTCQICKRKRPDKKIKVHTYLVKRMIVNIKYCNDNALCFKGALAKKRKGVI